MKEVTSTRISIEPAVISLWEEGHRATGSTGTAKFLGSYMANDMDDAVEQYLKKHPESKQYHRRNEDGTHAIWGCVLYDNEIDARKTFG